MTSAAKRSVLFSDGTDQWTTNRLCITLPPTLQSRRLVKEGEENRMKSVH